MENTIKTVTTTDISETTIEIDNSTQFKDFKIDRKMIDKNLLEESVNSELIRIDVCDKTNPIISIGNIDLHGRNAKLLVEFLNQIK